MKKTLCFAAFALLLSSSARAINVVSLPGLTSMPLNAPSVIPAHHPLSLPAAGTPTAVVLPSIATNLPKIAPVLPTLPMPVIGRPTIGLPSPVKPLPIAPIAVVQLAKAAPLAPAVHEDEAAQREKLQRLFDEGDSRDHSGRDEIRHTLPERDLLNEIGIQ